MDEARYFLKTSSFWIEEVGVSFKKNEPRLVKAVDALTITTERIGEVFTPENQKSIANILKNVDRRDRCEGARICMKDGKAAMKTLNSTMAQAEQAVTELRQVTRPFAERTPRILENLENGYGPVQQDHDRGARNRQGGRPIRRHAHEDRHRPVSF